MNMQQIKNIAKQGEFEKALEECENHLSNGLTEKVEVMRARSHVYTLMRNYEKALSDREAVLELEDCAIRDYYLAADCAIINESYDKAYVWLMDVLRLSDEEGEDWFLSAANFLLAYVQMKLGNYPDAIKFLDEAVLIEADCSMHIPEYGMCSSSLLRSEIEKYSRYN